MRDVNRTYFERLVQERKKFASPVASPVFAGAKRYFPIVVLSFLLNSCAIMRTVNSAMQAASLLNRATSLASSSNENQQSPKSAALLEIQQCEYDGHLYMQIGQYHQAAAYWELAGKLAKENLFDSHVMNAYYYLAVSQLGMDSITQAIHSAKIAQSTKEGKNNHTIAQMIADLSTISSLLKSPQIDPSNFVQIGRIKHSYSLYDGAIALYSKAIQLDDQFDSAYLYRAFSSLFKAQHTVTLQQNERLAIFPATDSLRRKQVLESVITDCDLLINRLQHQYLALRYRALAFEMLNQTEKSLQDYDNLIAMDTNLAETFASRAGLYARNQNYEKSIQDYTQAIYFDSTNASKYLVYRAQSKAKIQDISGALEDMNWCIQQNPTIENYSARALLNLKANKYFAAQEDYMLAAKISSSINKTMRDRYEKFAQIVQQIVSLDPNDQRKDNAQKIQILINRSKYLYSLGEYQGAERDINAVIEMSP